MCEQCQQAKCCCKAPDGQAFSIDQYCELTTLGELAVALCFMPTEVFEHYVDDEKNNFADWVENSFVLKDVAEALRGAEDQLAMARILQNR